MRNNYIIEYRNSLYNPDEFSFYANFLSNDLHLDEYEVDEEWVKENKIEKYDKIYCESEVDCDPEYSELKILFIFRRGKRYYPETNHHKT